MSAKSRNRAPAAAATGRACCRRRTTSCTRSSGSTFANATAPDRFEGRPGSPRGIAVLSATLQAYRLIGRRDISAPPWEGETEIHGSKSEAGERRASRDPLDGPRKDEDVLQQGVRLEVPGHPRDELHDLAGAERAGRRAHEARQPASGRPDVHLVEGDQRRPAED